MKTLAIILLTYLLLKYLGRIFAPIILKRFAKKMQDRFQEQFNYQNQNTQRQPQEEGKVTIEKINTSTKTKSDDVGEYVDFEEVDE